MNANHLPLTQIVAEIRQVMDQEEEVLDESSKNETEV
jgi:ElaB/YqjD/DUF883 family membrane-anchored ribosome-binding protein